MSLVGHVIKSSDREALCVLNRIWPRDKPGSYPTELFKLAYFLNKHLSTLFHGKYLKEDWPVTFVHGSKRGGVWTSYFYR